ncbi:M23 family metallopeptidase [Arenimonas sp.]|uniref:M23 family metallopeptidase n=1 Tax=Arenimonas sp. TaxID=1872635 RepID=UPI0035B1B19F
MRAGLVFLAGLLVGGLAVAWVVAEVPAERATGTQPAPATPEADTSGSALIAQAGPGPAQAPGPRPVAGQDIESTLDVAVDDAVQETIEQAPPLATVQTVAPPEAAPPLQEGPLLPPLRIPVQGVQAADLVDSFADARGTDRVHDALDIMAPEGTPVLAVADGPVVKLFDSVPGGITLYQFDDAGQVAFYYAHLQRYAEGIGEGRVLKQGELIGYVGHTGNANAAAPHLHFAIFVLGPDKRWWEGEAINPYPLLAGPAR